MYCSSSYIIMLLTNGCFVVIGLISSLLTERLVGKSISEMACYMSSGT